VSDGADTAKLCREMIRKSLNQILMAFPAAARHAHVRLEASDP
jgi:hypothetical protein